jgi:hypothetical protein
MWNRCNREVLLRMRWKRARKIEPGGFRLVAEVKAEGVRGSGRVCVCLHDPLFISISRCRSHLRKRESGRNEIEREREREREREKENVRMIERGRERDNVCVCHREKDRERESARAHEMVRD